MVEPYPPSPSFDIQTFPPGVGGTLPDQCQGVYITLVTQDYQFFLNKIVGWFADREEVDLVDHGISDKAHLGYIILEWFQREIDELFLAILRDEEIVADYSVFMRDL
jgi:hypothetical protein